MYYEVFGGGSVWHCTFDRSSCCMLQVPRIVASCLQGSHANQSAHFCGMRLVPFGCGVLMEEVCVPL